MLTFSFFSISSYFSQNKSFLVRFIVNISEFMLLRRWEIQLESHEYKCFIKKTNEDRR